MIGSEADMEEKVVQRLETLLARYPALAPMRGEITGAYQMLCDCFAEGRKLLIAGNGGSCADSEHMVGELMKGFEKKRPVPKELAEKLKEAGGARGESLAAMLQQGLPAISLSSHMALNTAFLNDVGGDAMFAQQLNVLGTAGDVLLAISTSGNSRNILDAAIVARTKGVKVIALTGKDGGSLAGLSDMALIVPSKITYQIQELHLPVYHCLCLMLEEHFFPDVSEV
jgi:D-sedoheptulose 7-phosphate isomerase